MARVEIDELVFQPSNPLRPAANVPFTITKRDGSSATVYDAETGGNAIAPGALLTDAFGRINGWVEEGRYTIVLNPPGQPSSTLYYEAAVGAGVAAHKATHAPGGSDALDYTLVHMSGTTAARPAASPANAGLLYFSTTDGSLARSDGAVWTNVVPQQLGYSESLADFTTTSATDQDVTNLSVTVTTTGRSILVIFESGFVNNATASDYAVFKIKEGATVLAGGYVGGNGNAAPVHRAVRLTPSAGSHTYKVTLRAFTGGAGHTAKIAGGGSGDPGPAYIYVVEV
jgi:hypothetical protein